MVAPTIAEKGRTGHLVGSDQLQRRQTGKRGYAPEPDVVLRPSHQIIVGTGFWNRPMFILREGIRTNYGFSLRLDRNFGNEVFGVPPFAGFGG